MSFTLREENVDKKKLCEEFVKVTDGRMHIFGSFFSDKAHLFYIYIALYCMFHLLVNISWCKLFFRTF